MQEQAKSRIDQWVHANLEFHRRNQRAEELWGATLVQVYVLHRIQFCPGISPQELAVVTGMHPSTLTQTLKRLHTRRWICIEEDPRDARRKMLLLTRGGRIPLARVGELDHL